MYQKLSLPEARQYLHIFIEFTRSSSIFADLSPGALWLGGGTRYSPVLWLGGGTRSSPVLWLGGGTRSSPVLWLGGGTRSSPANAIAVKDSCMLSDLRSAEARRRFFRISPDWFVVRVRVRVRLRLRLRHRVMVRVG